VGWQAGCWKETDVLCQSPSSLSLYIYRGALYNKDCVCEDSTCKGRHKRPFPMLLRQRNHVRHPATNVPFPSGGERCHGFMPGCPWPYLYSASPMAEAWGRMCSG
jgi:hypothetical protein